MSERDKDNVELGQKLLREKKKGRKGEIEREKEER